MKSLNENKGLFLNEEDYYDKEDLLNLIRLQRVLLEKKDLLFSIEECANIWQNYSWDLSASWLFFPEKDYEILTHIESSHNFTDYESYSKI